MLFGRQGEMADKGWFRKYPGRRPWRLSAKLLIASSIATVIGFSAICISVMLDMLIDVPDPVAIFIICTRSRPL